jgi:hypothetical protein
VPIKAEVNQMANQALEDSPEKPSVQLQVAQGDSDGDGGGSADTNFDQSKFDRMGKDQMMQDGGGLPKEAQMTPQEQQEAQAMGINTGDNGGESGDEDGGMSDAGNSMPDTANDVPDAGNSEPRGMDVTI